jgi:hypothetical protein
VNSYKDIQSAIDDNVNHVFLIISPIVAIMARLIIDNYKIPLDKVVCVPLRKSDTSLVGGKNLFVRSYFIDRVYKKLFYNSFYGKRIEKKIRKRGGKFLLYTPWDSPESMEIQNSKSCVGHVYLEEGQMSYNTYKIYTYSSNKNTQRKRLIQLRKNANNMTKNCDQGEFLEFFNDHALAFVGMLPEVFPMTPKDKRVILRNYSDIVNGYKPRLIGIGTIGLMCSPRRLHPDRWQITLMKLLEKLPDGSVIKLHPDFSANIEMRNKMVRILDEISNGAVVICDDDVIVEAEMLFETKSIIGPLTSLSRYTVAFGSRFEHIDLY